MYSLTINIAIKDLLSKIDEIKFKDTFGVSSEKAYDLLEAKTLSVSKLVAIAPPGTVDPTPFLYDSTMYSLAGIMTLSVLAHQLVRSGPHLQAKVNSNNKKKNMDHIVHF